MIPYSYMGPSYVLYLVVAIVVIIYMYYSIMVVGNDTIWLYGAFLLLYLVVTIVVIIYMYYYIRMFYGCG